MERSGGLVDEDATQVIEAVKPARRRGRWARVLIFAVVTGLVIAGGATAATALYVSSVERSIEKVDAFTEVPEESRPVKEEVAADALNLLLLGSDSRDPENTTGSRSDTIIVAHLPADRSGAQLISIPRDTWVHVPRSADGRNGDTDAKINSAYAWGGIPLMVRTVEDFTKVRMDHVVLVDFGGFQQIVDALGGIDIEVEQDFTSIHEPFREFTEGTMHMDGATALDYARQRYQFQDGDFARIRHQQQVIKAILDRAASGGMLSSPAAVNDFVKATANSVSVDQTLSILDLATQMRNVRGGNLTFLTTPTTGTGRVGDQSVVLADAKAATALYDAVRTDSVPDILAAARK
ncbi:LCP family protein required for cell wall assembly [Catenuloplanes nepalensis]|uniref:LCP family protein required for cell wall assembly n=1 Tax=Catenuloplanes nepalensis TaxID=587533 RepID=A0ABT9N5N3_9ACTN|nr:LCP family protein [Catenuloplanes nepalensis]MDP9798998.1 LCP family protein required for cell wall assembly [Catenuloplanes nepalensis]